MCNVIANSKERNVVCLTTVVLGIFNRMMKCKLGFSRMLKVPAFLTGVPCLSPSIVRLFPVIFGLISVLVAGDPVQSLLSIGGSSQ